MLSSIATAFRKIRKPVDDDSDWARKKFTILISAMAGIYGLIGTIAGALLKGYFDLWALPMIFLFVICTTITIHACRTVKKYHSAPSVVSMVAIMMVGIPFCFHPERYLLYAFWATCSLLVYGFANLGTKTFFAGITIQVIVTTFFAALHFNLQGLGKLFMENQWYVPEHVDTRVVYFGLPLGSGIWTITVICYEINKRTAAIQDENTALTGLQKVTHRFSEAIASYDTESAREILEDHNEVLGEELALAFEEILTNLDRYSSFLPAALTNGAAVGATTVAGSISRASELSSSERPLSIKTASITSPTVRGGRLRKKFSVLSSESAAPLPSQAWTFDPEGRSPSTSLIHDIFPNHQASMTDKRSIMPEKISSSNLPIDRTPSNPSSSAKASDVGSAVVTRSDNLFDELAVGNAETLSVQVENLDASDCSLPLPVYGGQGGPFGDSHGTFPTGTDHSGSENSAGANGSQSSPAHRSLRPALQEAIEEALRGTEDDCTVDDPCNLTPMHSSSVETAAALNESVLTRERLESNLFSVSHKAAIALVHFETCTTRAIFHPSVANSTTTTIIADPLRAPKEDDEEPGRASSPSASATTLVGKESIGNLLNSNTTNQTSSSSATNLSSHTSIAVDASDNTTVDETQVPSEDQQHLDSNTPAARCARELFTAVEILGKVCASVGDASIQSVLGPTAIVAIGLSANSENKDPTKIAELAAKFAIELRAAFSLPVSANKHDQDCDPISLLRHPCAVSCAIAQGKTLSGVVGDDENKSICILGPFLNEGFHQQQNVNLNDPDHSALHLMLAAARQHKTILVSGSIAEKLDGLYHLRGVDAVRWGATSAFDEQLEAHKNLMRTVKLYEVVLSVSTLVAQFSAHGGTMNRGGGGGASDEWMYLLKKSGEFCEAVNSALDHYCAGEYEEGSSILFSLPKEQRLDPKLQYLEKLAGQCELAAKARQQLELQESERADRRSSSVSSLPSTTSPTSTNTSSFVQPHQLDRVFTFEEDAANFVDSTGSGPSAHHNLSGSTSPSRRIGGNQVSSSLQQHSQPQQAHEEAGAWLLTNETLPPSNAYFRTFGWK